MTSPENPGGGDASPFDALLRLAELDREAAQLRYRIEHHEARAALDELFARHRALQASATPLRAEIGELDQRQQTLEAEIAEAEGRIRAIDDRLRSGGAGSYRDEEAMSQELAQLARRKSELEDRELELMEEREPLDGRLGEIERTEAEIGASARRLNAELQEATAGLEAELAGLGARRGELTGGIEASLLAEYDLLRTRLDGVGVARVVHGSCSGCHLSLSAGEIDRIHRSGPGALAHCEQCGRILVP